MLVHSLVMWIKVDDTVMMSSIWDEDGMVGPFKEMESEGRVPFYGTRVHCMVHCSTVWNTEPMLHMYVV